MKICTHSVRATPLAFFATKNRLLPIFLRDMPPPMNPLDNIQITDIHEGDLKEEISEKLKR